MSNLLNQLNVENLTASELEEAIKALASMQEAKVRQANDKKRALKNQVIESDAYKALQEQGVTLVWSDEQSKPKGNTGGEVAVKYRDKTGNSWTGRGLTPKWVFQAISETIGNSPDENTYKKALREGNKEKIAFYWDSKPKFILEALKALEVKETV